MIRKDIHRDPKYTILIVGYPKSGNTWLSRLVGDALNSPVTGMHNARPLCEEGLDRTGKFVVRQLHLKPIYREINPKEAVPNANTFNIYGYKGEKILHIIRDPRDVTVSVMHYWHMDTIREAFDAITRGISPLMGAGTWANFVDAWHVTQETYPIDIMQVKYEYLLEHADKVLDDFVRLLGIEDADIDGAVERQSFETRRKQIETTSQSFNYGKEIQLLNMRKGIAGDWKMFFDEDLLEKAIHMWSLQMRRYGYEAE